MTTIGSKRTSATAYKTAWSDIRFLLISINTNMKHAETPNDEILAVTNVDLLGADRPSPLGGLAGVIQQRQSTIEATKCCEMLPRLLPRA